MIDSKITSFLQSFGTDFSPSPLLLACAMSDMEGEAQVADMAAGSSDGGIIPKSLPLYPVCH